MSKHIKFLFNYFVARYPQIIYSVDVCFFYAFCLLTVRNIYLFYYIKLKLLILQWNFYSH